MTQIISEQNKQASVLSIPVDIADAFDHLLVIGLASIIEDALKHPVHLHWTSRREVLLDSHGDLDAESLGAIVHAHASRHATSDWLNETRELAGGQRSPLSPRIGSLPDRQAFRQLESARRELIDSIGQRDWLTLRQLGSLGRPIDWSVNEKSETLPDRGASAWEMKTRNRGEEFVQNRLSKLAHAVTRRSEAEVAAGLLGTSLVDEAGKNALDSRTPTGLRAPGPVDNARAWAALWGISAFPVQPVTGQRDSSRQASTTAGALRLSHGNVWFYLPIIEQPKTVASLRAVIRSAHLARQALQAILPSQPTDRGPTARDFEWLVQHDVSRFVVFERAKSENANAPELYALPGRTFETRRTPATSAQRRDRSRTFGGTPVTEPAVSVF